MKLTTAAAASLFTIAAATAGAQTSGVSHPEELNDSITTTAAPSAHYVKPSPAIPAAAPAALKPAAVVEPSTPTLHAHDSDTYVAYKPVVEAASVAAAPKRGFTVDPNDPNSGVIVEVAAGPNELPEGTLLRASLDDQITSETAKRGDRFSAHLTADIKRNGKVLIPTGSLLRGRITEVRPGKTFGAGAMMRLQPDTITLPDGTRFPLDAQLIDFDHESDIHHDSHVRGEGEIVANQHVKERLGATALGAAGAASAGAILGGGIGAGVGALVGVTAGIVLWAKADHQQTLPQGTVMVLNLNQSLFLTPDGQ